jgi:hypothetical protein
LSAADALELVEKAAKRLWDGGAPKTLDYLRMGRGLSDATIRQAGLGYTPGVMLPKRDGTGSWCASGIVIPWWDRGRLALVKIRQPDGRKPKYAEAYRDRPTIFPSLSAIRPGEFLVISEGDFDTLLLGQKLEGLAAVVTLGSASARPNVSIIGAMLSAPTWFVAHHADGAGDRSAEGWPRRARRVRPPAPHNDWTDAYCAGVDLRRWWSDLLGVDRAKREEVILPPSLAAVEAAPGSPAEEEPTLEPAASTRPREADLDRLQRIRARFAALAVDSYARQERAAIMMFDGGLSWAEAERWVGLR